jgi:hypothetical protein
VSEDLLAGVERVLRERGGREINTTDFWGSPLRIFFDGPTVCCDCKGEVTPFEGLCLETQKQVYHESGAELSAPTPKAKAADEPEKPEPDEKGLDPMLDPSKNPFIRLD